MINTQQTNFHSILLLLEIEGENSYSKEEGRRVVTQRHLPFLFNFE